MKLSVTIITYNEEKNIARAIKSVDFANEIIVVDSGSTDKTQEIVKSLGARLEIHPFQSYGNQKNYAAGLCKHDWILNIDADEEVGPELKNKINEIVKTSQPPYIYKIARRTSFAGRWIYHGGWYPDYKTRLVKKGTAVWSEPNVHEDLLPTDSTATVGFIREHLNHYSFPNVESQIITNLKYAKLGARDFLQDKKRTPFLLEVFIKPIGKFFECYLWKGGILDGLPGLIIAINASYSMFMKYCFAYFDMRSGQ